MFLLSTKTDFNKTNKKYESTVPIFIWTSYNSKKQNHYKHHCDGFFNFVSQFLFLIFILNEIKLIGKWDASPSNLKLYLGALSTQKLKVKFYHQLCVDYFRE